MALPHLLFPLGNPQQQGGFYSVLHMRVGGMGSTAGTTGHSRASRYPPTLHPVTPQPTGVHYPEPILRKVPGIRYFAPQVYEIEFEQARIKALEDAQADAQEAKRASVVKQRKALASMRGQTKRIDEVKGELTGIAEAIKAEALAKRAAKARSAVKALALSEIELAERAAYEAFDLFSRQAAREIAAARQRIEYQLELDRQAIAKQRLWEANQQAIAVLLLTI